MGRRFQEQFINQHKPAVSGGIRTTPIRQEHMTPVVCGECGGRYFDRVMNIYRLPAVVSSGRTRQESLTMVEVMCCRCCGRALENEDIPAFVKDHGKLERCRVCAPLIGAGELFAVGYGVQRVSRLAVGAAKDQIVLAPAYFCKDCGAEYGYGGEKIAALPPAGKADEKESRLEAAPTNADIPQAQEGEGNE